MKIHNQDERPPDLQPMYPFKLYCVCFSVCGRSASITDKKLRGAAFFECVYVNVVDKFSNGVHTVPGGGKKSGLALVSLKSVC